MTIETTETIRDWETYISLGLIAREAKDDSNWRLGDLALGISKDYGEDSIGKYAYAISVPKKSLMNNRTIAKRFTQDIRTKYKKLSWSHFEAVSANKIQRPEAWLEKADDEELSVEGLRKLVNEAYPDIGVPDLNDDPPEVYKCEECGRWRLRDVSSLEICRGHYKIEKRGNEYDMEYK
jgi:hypothetical protein